MKTIFITSFHQFISRNILQTPIIDGLLSTDGVRIVIVAPAGKREYFEKTFKRDKVVIEYVGTSRAANGFWSLVYKRAIQAMGDLRYKEVLRGFRAGTVRGTLVNLFFYYPMHVIGRFSIVQNMVRAAGGFLVKNGEGAALFAKYAPEAVFSTDMQNENDVLVMLEAKRRKVKIISMMRSWDNIEMFGGVLRVVPDTLLVWGDFSKQGILKANALRADMVQTVGVPHYDRYLKGPTMSKEAFFNSLGADLTKKLILFTPVGDMYMKENDVDGFVLSELAKFDANILVRMPPADTVSLGTFTPPKNVFFYQPGTAVDAIGRREISRADDDHLINSLHFATVVVSGPSTIMLDAVVLDKPVVLFGFERNPKRYRDSVASLYDSRHLQAVIQRGAARFAKTVNEFHDALVAYLNDPHKDHHQRASAVSFVCFKTDGKSCQRVVEAMRAFL